MSCSCRCCSAVVLWYCTRIGSCILRLCMKGDGDERC